MAESIGYPRNHSIFLRPTVQVCSSTAKEVKLFFFVVFDDRTCGGARLLRVVALINYLACSWPRRYGKRRAHPPFLSLDVFPCFTRVSAVGPADILNSASLLLNAPVRFADSSLDDMLMMLTTSSATLLLDINAIIPEAGTYSLERFRWFAPGLVGDG